MCSITDVAEAPVTVPRFARLVEHAREAAAAVGAALAEDPSLLAELPDDTLEATVLALHAAVDSASAAATVVTGRLER